MHTAKLRIELSQSRTEQRDYLKNVELARVLEKRAAKKREKGENMELKQWPKRKRLADDDDTFKRKVKKLTDSAADEPQMSSVLSSVF